MCVGASCELSCVCQLVCVGVRCELSCVCQLVCVGASCELSCVCHLLCVGVRCELKHALKILSVLLLFTVIMHVAVLKLLFDQYTLCTGIPLHFPRYTINILSALIISILPHIVIAVQQK